MSGVNDVVEALGMWIGRLESYSLFRDYREGNHRLRFATPTFRRHYEWVLRDAKENLCEAVVDTFTAPIDVESWEGTGAAGAERAMDDFNLPLVLSLAVEESHTCGDGYVLVWPDESGQPYPYFNEAHLMVVKSVGGRKVWAAKVWHEQAADSTPAQPRRQPRVNIYYDDRVERWTTAHSMQDNGDMSRTVASDWWPARADAWYPYDADGEGEVIPHDFGEVPVVHLTRKPRSVGGVGRSVLANVVPLQDGLNHSLASLIVGNEAFAQPLRVLLNLRAQAPEPEMVNGELTMVKKKTSLEVDPTKSSILGFEGEGLSMVQLDPPDATKLIAVQDSFALKIARVVGAPAFYFTQTSGDVPSGASLRVLASRLTNAVRDWTRTNTGEVARLMSLLGVEDARPVWANPAPMDEVERFEVLKHKKDLGWPVRELMIDAGEDPVMVDRWLAEQADGQATAAAEALRRFRAGEDF